MMQSRGESRISRKGGLKIIFTMGEGTEGRTPPIRGLARFFTFPFIYM